MMKLSPSVKGFIIAVAALAVSFGIYFAFLQKENHYLADNPTDQTYYFKINDGSELILAAGQFVPVNLRKGKNKISVYGADRKHIYDSAFTVNAQRGLLNITHADYFIHEQYYGYNIRKDSLLLSLDKTIIDGKMYMGAPRKFSGLYTEDFYYNLNEKYDAMVKNIQKTESRSKIFRKQDFINYYREYYQQ